MKKLLGRAGVDPEAQASGYPNEALTGSCVRAAGFSRLRLGSPGLESRGVPGSIACNPNSRFFHKLKGLPFVLGLSAAALVLVIDSVDCTILDYEHAREHDSRPWNSANSVTGPYSARRPRRRNSRIWSIVGNVK